MNYALSVALASAIFIFIIDLVGALLIEYFIGGVI